MILQPRLVALDRSHWEQWISDATATEAGRRENAARFSAELLAQGYTILFCMHHLQELMAHGNDDEVSRRLRFVQSVPFLSWIGIVDSDDRGLGAITDIMAAEVVAALEGLDAAGVRLAARQSLLRSGAGYEPIPDHPDFLPFIRAWSREHSDRSRTLAALAPMQFLPSGGTIRTLLDGKMRKGADLAATLKALFRKVLEEINSRGDKRITNPGGRAAAFMNEVLATRARLPDSLQELVMAGYSLQGIDADEIDPDATFAEMDALCSFRGHLRVVAEKLGLDFDRVKRRLQPDLLPHLIVLRALEGHAQERPRRQGSDLNDRYLASLSVYADVVFVDKRTREDFGRARRKESELDRLVGRVERAASYRDIPSVLNEVPEGRS
jgi:hypothetical protein